MTAFSRAALLVLLVFLHQASQGMVLDDASSSASMSNATSVSWSHTVGSGSDRLLVVGVSYVLGGSSISSVTYGGTELTLWSSDASASFPSSNAEMWYLTAPPSGTATIEVNFSGNGTWGVAGATSWSGVDQADPLGPAVSANGTGGTATLNLTSSVDDVVVDVVSLIGINATATAGAGQTEYWNAGVLVRNGGSSYGAASSEPGAANVENSWTFGNPLNWTVIAANIQAGTTVPDVTPPTVDITSPAGGTTVSATVTIEADASDDVGVVGVQFQLDGVDLGTEDLTAPYSLDWDTTAEADGDYELTAVARDAADNQTTSLIVNVTVDNSPPPDVTPPTVDITSPAGGTTVSATVTIEADASDDVGVVGVQFQLDGVDLGAEDLTAPYSLDWDTTAEADGDYELTAVARDAADNQTTSSVVTVTVDNSLPPDVTPPTVDITSPADAAVLSGSVTIEADASDDVGVVGVQFQLDGVDLGAEDTTEPYSIQWDTTSEANGDYEITAVARDAADNQTTSAAIDVSVDNAAGSADIVHDSSSSATLANGTSVSWTHTTGASADRLLVVGISHVAGAVSSVTYGGVALTEWASVSSTDFTGVTADLYYLVAPPAGSATVQVTFSSGSWGTVGASTWSGVNQSTPLGTAVTASGTANTASVNVASTADEVVHDVIAWSGAGVSGTAGAGQTEYWSDVTAVRNGGSVYGAASSETGSASTEMSWTVSGAFGWSLIATSVLPAGEQEPDVTPPTIDITSPLDATTVSDVVTIEADASDDVGVVGVQFQVNGVNVGAEDLSAPFSADWDTTLEVDGDYSLTAIARDAADNQTTSATIIVTVDNSPPPDVTPPTVDITSPLDSSTVSGSVTIQADASDDVGVVGVQFQVDGLDIGAEDTTAPYSIAWDTTLEANGDYALTAVARDAADNQATSATVIVTVDNSVASPPTVTITEPADGTSVADGTSLTFAGTADDAEDGTLDDDIDWSSDIDGTLGTGSSIDVTLSVGTHIVTASVTDSDTEVGTDTVSVTVTSVGGTARPNILFILADDLGADASEIFPELAGDTGQVSTPTISSLANEGIVFENAWASPACSPTRGTLVSGLYGHNTGLTNVGDVLPSTTTSIWEYISASSPEPYAMGVFGKWHIGNTIDHITNQTGVPEFRGIIGGLISNFYSWTVNDSEAADSVTTTYATTALTDFAIDFITEHENSANADDPWFVYLPYNAPHGTSANDGHQVPPADLFTVDVEGREPGSSTIYFGQIPVYKAVIQAMDTEMGRLLDEIEALQEMENTVIIFMGDNGTPGPIQDANVGNRGSKSSVYEGGVHVPLIIKGAGVTRIGERETDIVTSSDIYATIAELTGIPVSEINNSYSLVPLFTDDAADSGRQYSFTEICGFGQTRYAIRDDRYKVLYAADQGGFAMYDLQDDPLEENNLYDDPSVAAEQAILEAELDVLAQAATSGGCFQ